MIAYDVIYYNKNTDEYELKDLPFDNKLQHLEPGNYIINEQPFEKFLEVIFRAQQEYDIKYIYAHNGSKYDTVLFLSYIINNNININYEPLFNNGKLL